MGFAARPAISFPTWGRAEQIRLDISAGGQHLSSFKVGGKAAYKNLPLNPEHADACIATLWNPTDGLWYGCRPRALLFGDVAAAIRYNLFLAPSQRWRT